MPSSKRKAVAPPKGPTAKQQQLEQLPLLKKPLEVVGEKLVNFPGSFWEGRMTAEENIATTQAEYLANAQVRADEGFDSLTQATTHAPQTPSRSSTPTATINEAQALAVAMGNREAGGNLVGCGEAGLRLVPTAKSQLCTS